MLVISKTLDENISEKGVLVVLKNIKNSKSPGNDGFTAEFYFKKWNDLKPHIMSAIHCIYRKKELSISQRLGTISCLPKGDKPRQFLKNWRPFTLLNVLSG